MNREILTAREKCLDCQSFVKKHLFSREFVCQFGLIPVGLPDGDKGNVSVVCLVYSDTKGKDSKARKAVKKQAMPKIKPIQDLREY